MPPITADRQRKHGISGVLLIPQLRNGWTRPSGNNRKRSSQVGVQGRTSLWHQFVSSCGYGKETTDYSGRLNNWGKG